MELTVRTVSSGFAHARKGFDGVLGANAGKISSALGRIVAGIALVAGISTVTAAMPPADDAAIVWKLDHAGSVGGFPTTVLGAPQIIRESGGGQVRFDGKADGWIVPANPLAGWESFTVEVLLRPAPDGFAEARFIHLEDDAGRRLMFEVRLTDNGQWALDTFLFAGSSSGQLLDRKLLHSADRWHWAALVYDQGRMTSFVDGQQELSGSVAFTPMVSGHVGIGFRMNRVFWYKGDIREIRFHPTALPAPLLARALPPI